MLKIASISWVVLTVVIVLIPVLYVSYFFSMKVIKLIKLIAYKSFKINQFQKIKTDLMQDIKDWKSYFRQWNKFDFKNTYNGLKIIIIKMKSFFKPIAEKIKILQNKLYLKISNVDLKSIHNIKKIQNTESKNNNPEVVYEKIKIAKDDASFLWVNINLDAVINAHSGQKEEEIEELSLEERESILRNKKLIEKIIYESLVFKKEWRFDEYEKKIIEWLAIDSDDKELNKLLAEYYFSIWNHKKALSMLKKIIDVDPKDHKAIRQIGEIYLVWGEYEVAEILINRAISMNWDNPKYYASLVELLYNTDRRMDAITVLENELIRLRPSNLDYLITLAELYEEMWEIQNAKKYYFRILEQDQSNEKIKRKLQKITEDSIL